MNVLNWLKSVCAAICGLFSYVYGGLDMLLTTLLVLMAMDYLTGVLSALYHKKISSSVGFRGILKKVVMLCIVGVSHMLGRALGAPSVRDLVVGFYIANEGISILENAGKVNVPVCKQLLRLLNRVMEREK